MILTIGAFDGFHKGHARLLEEAHRMAAGEDWGVVTFHPHPDVLFQKLDAPLFPLRERELIRRTLGIPHLFTFQFDPEIQSLAPEDFWERLKGFFLQRGIPIDGIVMGRDFRFGRNRTGTAPLLEALCRRDGLRVSVLDLLQRDGVRFSSTETRQDVMAGEMRRAADVLGYPWFLWSQVIRGDQRGRSLGFPTANFDPGERLLPAPGVYVSALPIRGEWHCGALSIGDNPTFNVEEPRVEVFVLDFDGDLYGEDLPLLVLDRLRPLGRFSDSGALVKQIAQDVAHCRRLYQEEVAARSEFLIDFAAHFDAMNREGSFVPQIWRLTESC